MANAAGPYMRAAARSSLEGGRQRRQRRGVVADALGGNDVTDRVPGWAARVMLRSGGVSLIGEHLRYER